MSIPPRQQDLLRFIIGFQAAHGYAPSYIEMAEGIGLTSTGTMSRWLAELEQAGHIRRLFKRVRSIEVLVSLPIPRAPDGAPLHVVPGIPKALSLTPMQQATLEFITDFHRDWDVVPTLEQIAEGAKLRSPQAAFAILLRLEELGLIKTRQGGKRVIAPVLEEPA